MGWRLYAEICFWVAPCSKKYYRAVWIHSLPPFSVLVRPRFEAFCCGSIIALCSGGRRLLYSGFRRPLTGQLKELFRAIEKGVIHEHSESTQNYLWSGNVSSDVRVTWCSSECPGCG